MPASGTAPSICNDSPMSIIERRLGVSTWMQPILLPAAQKHPDGQLGPLPPPATSCSGPSGRDEGFSLVGRSCDDCGNDYLTQASLTLLSTRRLALQCARSGTQSQEPYNVIGLISGI
ncbi:hypothetical protein VTK56DRAFT_7637 [Thermocarpiscus australiensis]